MKRSFLKIKENQTAPNNSFCNHEATIVVFSVESAISPRNNKPAHLPDSNAIVLLRSSNLWNTQILLLILKKIDNITLRGRGRRVMKTTRVTLILKDSNPLLQHRLSLSLYTPIDYPYHCNPNCRRHRRCLLSPRWAMMGRSDGEREQRYQRNTLTGPDGALTNDPPSIGSR